MTTRFGTTVTGAFFTEGKHKKKQLRMYQKALKDFMPVVSEERDATLLKCACFRLVCGCFLYSVLWVRSFASRWLGQCLCWRRSHAHGSSCALQLSSHTRCTAAPLPCSADIVFNVHQGLAPAHRAGDCREGGVTASLPAHILVERCLTLKEALKEADNPQEKLHELFTICQHLTKLLQMQHRRSIVLRDINTRNVVKAQFGASRTWTLLEYCNAARAGTKTDALPAWSIPPEARCLC